MCHQDIHRQEIHHREMRHHDFEERLRRALVQSRYSQAAFARALNRHPSTVNKWIAGVNQIPLEALLEACKILGITPEETRELLCLVGYSASWLESEAASATPSPSTTPSPNTSTGTATSTDPCWSGIVDVDSRGLALIQGYDLWFTSQATGQWRIWHLDSTTGAAEPVAFEMPGNSISLDQFVPAVSPHGDEIAFSAGRLVAEGVYSRNLFLANLDGTNVKQLTDSHLDYYHPTWSPLSHQLAYSVGSYGHPSYPDQGYGIWTLDIDSGDTRQLTDRGDYDPAWSPDGSRIAFQSKANDWNVTILRVDDDHRPTNAYEHWMATTLQDIACGATWINANKIIFSSKLGAYWQIQAIPIAPFRTFVRPSQLTTHEWDSLFPVVCDGHLLLWQSFRHEPSGNEGAGTDKIAVLYIMDVETREQAPLITGIGNARNGILKRRG